MLIPREHGAYGQLLFPLCAALLIGHPTPGAWLLSGAAVGAFLAHEALLVTLGQRGSRAAREQRDEARRSLALFGGFAVVTGVVALSVLPRPALLGLVIPALFASLVAVALFSHRERTTAGEIVVGAALASVAVPVALAGDVDVVAARTLFLVFASVFTVATMAVRGMIVRVTKRTDGPHWTAALGTSVLLPLALWALAREGRVAAIAPWASLPVVLVGVGLTLRPPSPQRLRVVGWTLVAATLATTLVVIVGVLQR